MYSIFFAYAIFSIQNFQGHHYRTNCSNIFKFKNKAFYGVQLNFQFLTMEVKVSKLKSPY